MNSDDFEKRLQRVPLREIPSEWRENILRQAMPSRPSTLDPRPSFWSALLWPNPKAWAALAAVWVIIFAIQFETGNRAPLVATMSISSRTQTVTTLKEQQKILVELMENNEPHESDKPRRFPAQPHSELRKPLCMA